jgi:sortase (surface protein transpeptidase)
MPRLRSITRPVARLSGGLLGLVPAFLAGAGVFLIVTGLFYYLQPVAAQPNATPTPAPSESIALYSLPPLASIGPSVAPSAGASPMAAIATRVRIPQLGVDLPIVGNPNEEFPLCDVAEYLTLDKALAYPGLPQATYLYAHARKNMFLPLLTASKVNAGDAMLGMWVEVYTDDNQRHIYEITQVIRGLPPTSSSLDKPLGATTDQLWLQTSEGPRENSTKLEVVAEPIPGVLAASQADAHPTGKGNVCPDAPFCKTSNGTGCRRR